MQPDCCSRRRLLAWAGLVALSGCSSAVLSGCSSAALSGRSSVPQRAPVTASVPQGQDPFAGDAVAEGMSAPLPPAGTLDRDVPDQLAREVTFLALSLIDTPYRYGGNTPESGFDCSGLIVYVYREVAGMALPRTVARLASAGRTVPASAMRTGDLLLFDTSGRFSHAGIFVGDARFVHAPSTGGTVRLDTIRTPYWRTRFSGVRRI